jgi:hypothetical protein
MRRVLQLIVSTALVAAIAAPPLPARAEQAPAGRFVEVRSYNLKPGTRDRFHRLFLEEALPMLERWQVEVIAYGPSLHDRDSYFLIRAFRGLEERQKEEDAFYGSGEWINGPRERVLADIDSYTTVVMRLDEATVAGLRKTGAARLRQ